MKKIAVVSFEGLTPFSQSTSKNYYFLTILDDLEKGDTLTVQSLDTLALAKFIKYTEETGDIVPDKWVVGKVDTEFYDKIKENEKRKIQLNRQIQERYKLYTKVDKVRVMACFDDKMAKMFEELDALDGKKPFDARDEIKGIQLKNTF